MSRFVGEPLTLLADIEAKWRAIFGLHWLVYRRPHAQACESCRGLTEASGECDDCNQTGAKPGTELWDSFVERDRKRAAGERVHLLQGEWGGWRR